MSVFVEGEHPELGRLLAAVDPSVRYVEGKVASRRFSALLTPFRSHEEAEAAMAAAGARIEEKPNVR